MNAETVLARCPDCGEPVMMEELPPISVKCGNCALVYDVEHDEFAGDDLAMG